MDQVPPPPVPTQLIVFADDWGRHPSSSQHLIRELLPHYPTLWVNTVGTRRPRLNLADLKRGSELVASWLSSRKVDDDDAMPEGLRVIRPKMYPGYRTAWQRKINARCITKAVNKAILPDHRSVIITTLPTTSDLVGKIDAERWVYYCVDDYSQWPGADHLVMDTMERQLLDKIDSVACVSTTLQDRMSTLGHKSTQLLTHGVDLKNWQSAGEAKRPIALFWGLIDDRLDPQYCKATVQACGTMKLHSFHLAGPIQTDAYAYSGMTHVCLHGPVDFERLPRLASQAGVLVMPYIDAPVTRAMQPLKLLEYLATMKPVVVRDLPSTRAWADCCDLASDADRFTQLVAERAETGTPPEQLEARRRRLAGESWTAKAAQLAALINAG